MPRERFSAALNLAAWLHDDLEARKTFFHNGHYDTFYVGGFLSLNGGMARCSISVRLEWPKRPPLFTCHEPWLKHGADWHAYDDGSLCYVFDTEWYDKISGLIVARGEHVAAQVARFWIFRNARWLLNKHLLADQLGISDWPHKEWPFYPHGYQAALREYLRAGSRRYQGKNR